MATLIDFPVPSNKRNDVEYLQAFEDFKKVSILLMTECATFRQAMPMILARIASNAVTTEQLKEKTNEIRRRIVRYFKGKINVEGFSGRSDLKTDDNPNKIRCLFVELLWIRGLIVALEPDIIILNEIKAKEDDFAAVVRAIEGFEYLSIPSSAPKGRSMRGTAIVYRRCSKFSIKSAGQEEFGSDKDALDGGTTIVAGDLNMDKNKFVEKWKTGGFVDSLAFTWATNRSRNTLTSIDYVMQSGKNALVCHRPIQPDSESVHFVIPFDIGVSGNRDYCIDPNCIFNCAN